MSDKLIGALIIGFPDEGSKNIAKGATVPLGPLIIARQVHWREPGPISEARPVGTPE